MKITEDQLANIKQNSGGIEVMQLPNGILAYKGPWIPDYFDNYTECLYANINHRRNEEARKRGLNEQFQTPAQQAEFEKRRKIQMELKRRAEIAAELAGQATLGHVALAGSVSESESTSKKSR